MRIPRPRKSSYRLGRRLKAGAKARLDYITYLQSGGDPSLGRVPETGWRAVMQGGGSLLAGLRIGLKLSAILQGEGAVAGRIISPRSLAATLSGGGNLVSPLAIVRYLSGTVAGEGELFGHMFPPHRVTGFIEGGGEITAKLVKLQQIKGTVDGGGELTAKTSQLPVNLSALINAEGMLTSALAIERRLAGTVSGEGELTANIAPTIPSVRVLLVAGGGGGGRAGSDPNSAPGGGGGGGGVIDTVIPLPSGPYAIVVGVRGLTSAPGTNSTALGFTAQGGGAGSAFNTSAGNGGSGGGGRGGYGSVVSTAGGTGTSGQGNAGAAGMTSPGGIRQGSGGGGGGAASAGAAGPSQIVGGAGGQGLSSDISGTATVYGSGGGGGAGGGISETNTGGAGGTGAGNGAGAANLVGGVGIANRGSGGGGAKDSAAGGAGTSGIVIIRYAGAARATGGTITTVGSDTVHTFTANGTFVFNEPAYPFVNAEAAAVVAAMTVAPDNARKAKIDTLVGALKSAGVWDKLDVLNVLYAHTEQAAFLNWKNTAKYTMTKIGNPVFVPDFGVKTETAADAGRLVSGFNSSTITGADNFTTASSSMGVMIDQTTQNSEWDIYAFGVSTPGTTQFVGRATTNQTLARLNSTGQLAGAPQTTSHVLGGMTRSGSTVTINEDANVAATMTLPFSAVDAKIGVGGRNVGGSANAQIGSGRNYEAFFVGGYLGSSEWAAFANALRTFVTPTP